MTARTLGASVSLHSLSHHFAGTGEILSDLHLEIQAGEFISILGPSGCGKSTLLRFLGDLDHPSQGRVDFGPNSDSLVRGFVFQEPRLLPWRRILDNVKLPLELQGKSRNYSEQKAKEALVRVGLGDALEKFPAQLSGGMKMRASVARALVFQPSLLLLDEPFSALDEQARHGLQDDLRLLWESLNMTVVFVTHSVAEAVYLSNRAIVLSQRPARIVGDQVIDLPRERVSSLRLESEFSREMRKIAKFLSPQEAR